MSRFSQKDDQYLYDHRDDCVQILSDILGRSKGSIRNRLENIREPTHRAYQRLFGDKPAKKRDSNKRIKRRPIKIRKDDESDAKQKKKGWKKYRKAQSGKKWSSEDDVYLWIYRDDSVQILADTFERTRTSIKCRLETLREPDSKWRKRLFQNLPKNDTSANSKHDKKKKDKKKKDKKKKEKKKKDKKKKVNIVAENKDNVNTNNYDDSKQQQNAASSKIPPNFISNPTDRIQNPFASKLNPFASDPIHRNAPSMMQMQPLMNNMHAPYTRYRHQMYPRYQPVPPLMMQQHQLYPIRQQMFPFAPTQNMLQNNIINRKRDSAVYNLNNDNAPAAKRQKLNNAHAPLMIPPHIVRLQNKKKDVNIEDFQKRMRAAKFKKTADEMIANPYYVGQNIQINDSTSGLWINAIVIDKENNWIIAHFDGCSSIYDQQIHVINKKDAIRNTKLEEKHQEESDEEVPDHFCDPITFEPMKEPTLVMVSGVTYEKSVIEEYINEKGEDPMTRKAVTIQQLVPNRALRDTIDAWRKKHPGIISDDDD